MYIFVYIKDKTGLIKNNQIVNYLSISTHNAEEIYSNSFIEEIYIPNIYFKAVPYKEKKGKEYNFPIHLKCKIDLPLQILSKESIEKV